MPLPLLRLRPRDGQGFGDGQSPPRSFCLGDRGKRVRPVVVCEQFGVAPPHGNRPQRPFRFATSQMILKSASNLIVEPGVRCARAVRGRCARLWAQSAADVRGRGPCARRYRHICLPLESDFVSERNIKNIGGKTLPDIDPSQVPTCLPGSRGVCEAFWHRRGPGHASEDQLLSAAAAVVRGSDHPLAQAILGKPPM